MLHKAERRTLTTKEVRETEAEAVAFVVCQSIGLETGNAFSDYIRLWNGDAKLLQESLEVVQRTAAVILGAISPRPEPTPEPESEAPAPEPFAPPPPVMAETAESVPF